MEFTYLKRFDEEKMKNYKYNLTVASSSSRYGAYFKGAVGSTLLVDDVEVICEEKPANQPDNPTMTMNKNTSSAWRSHCCVSAAYPPSLSKFEYRVKAGFNIGGTTLLPLPAEIRN